MYWERERGEGELKIFLGCVCWGGGVDTSSIINSLEGGGGLKCKNTLLGKGGYFPKGPDFNC